MSKFPNHGLFTRTAAASTRSSSLIAQARRGAPRRRSNASSQTAALSLPTSSTTASCSQSHSSSTQTCSNQQPFIGPLTFAASQKDYTQQPSGSTSAADYRTEASSSSTSNHTLTARHAGRVTLSASTSSVWPHLPKLSQALSCTLLIVTSHPRPLTA